MREVTVRSKCAQAGLSISTALSVLLKKNSVLPVILCIGSDRITGDCLGPLVGHLLVNKYDLKCFIYGTLNNTVTALNVERTAAFIAKTHTTAKVIAVDAALGCEQDIGKIQVRRGGLIPGAALGNPLQKVGDISITAIVNTLSGSGASLKSTRLSAVFKLAEEIALGIKSALEDFPSA